MPRVSIAAALLPLTPATNPVPLRGPPIRLIYAEYKRVTDGTRTRDLRSHNPMLYQLSYGHHAYGDSISERVRSKRDAGRLQVCSVSPAEELGLLVVALTFVDYAEEPGGARGLDDHHVSLYVVDLDGDAEVVSWFVLVGHFACDLNCGLLLAIAVATQLEGLVRVQAPRTDLPCVSEATEDGPDVGHAVLVAKHYGDTNHIVYRVSLELYPVSRHCNLL